MEFNSIIGKTLSGVELSEDKEKFTLSFKDGTTKSYGVEGDCCSSSWIEHLTEPPDLDGAILLSVEDGSGEPYDGHSCSEPEEGQYNRPCGHDCLQVYATRFHTNRGTIVLEYRNDSNGYYGGSLVELP